MKMLAFIPASTAPINQLAELLTAASLANSYDEVIIEIGETNNQHVMRNMLSVMTALKNGFWLKISTIKADDDNENPSIAYARLLDRVKTDVLNIWGYFTTAGIGSRLKGFAFDIDYDRRLGNAQLNDATPKYFDRTFVNTLIAECHTRNKGCMIITSHGIDMLGRIYRSDVPYGGNATWTPLLGSVSGIKDWLVIRDAYASAYFTNGYQSPIKRNPWMLAANVPIARARAGSALSIGYLQHVNYNVTSPDYHIGHSYSVSLTSHIRGLTSFFKVIGAEGAGIIALSNPAAPMLPVRNSIEPYTFTEPVGAKIGSLNGTLFAKYVIGTEPHEMTFANNMRDVMLDGVRLV